MRLPVADHHQTFEISAYLEKLKTAARRGATLELNGLIFD